MRRHSLRTGPQRAEAELRTSSFRPPIKHVGLAPGPQPVRPLLSSHLKRNGLRVLLWHVNFSLATRPVRAGPRLSGPAAEAGPAAPGSTGPVTYMCLCFWLYLMSISVVKASFEMEIPSFWW